MKGFLKRDWALLNANLWYYSVIVLFFFVLATFTNFSAPFISFYLVIFAATSIISLFSYDDLTRWNAYAAAVPRGRQAAVDARYLFCALMGGTIFVLELVFGLVSWEGQLETAYLYCCLFLLYAALTLPFFYLFGGIRARIAMVCTVAALAATFAAGGAALSFSGDGFILARLWSLLPILLPLVAAVLFVLSWLLSRRIMAKKEL